MSLTSYVGSFEVQAPAGRIVSGTPIHLVAAPQEILDVAEVISGVVDLQFVFKHVQLPKESSTAWPPPATAVISNVTSGLQEAPEPDKVEAWLAAVTGTVPLGIRDVSDQIRIDFEWVITDVATGADLTGIMAVLDGGTDADHLSFVLPPIVSELTTTDFSRAIGDDSDVAQKITVQLKVRGRMGTTVDTGHIELASPIALDIVAIPLPSVAALFRDDQLDGNAVLVMVPNESPFSSADQLFGVLTPLRNVLTAVHNAASVAGWAAGTQALLFAVAALITKLPHTKYVGFQALDGHSELKDYNFIERAWKSTTSMHDRGSSCLVLSATGRITFFQNTKFRGNKLLIDATPQIPPDAATRFGGAVIRTLHAHILQSEPSGSVTADSMSHREDGWGDAISSYSWEPLTADEA
jgi:hypothetical protein